MSVLFRSRMRVLGISVWIYFIWIFVVGILLFFHTVKPVENFQTAGSGSRSGSRFLTRTLSRPGIWVLNYNPNSGTSQNQWQPINATTDRLLYQQKLPIGGQLYSPNGKYSLLFGTDHILYLYIVNTSSIIWSALTGANSSYLFHEGDINIINTDSTVAADATNPFVKSSATNGSLWSGSSYNKNKSYLQMQDNGDLVLYSFDGTVIFHTNTAIANVFQCVIEQIAYQFTPSDCFTLNAMIEAQRTAIATATTEGKTIQANAGKQILCNLEPYYNTLSCITYLRNTNPASAAPPTPPLTPPTVAITGSISTGLKTITTNGDLSQSVSPGDMIYLGYGDFVGPFVVASATATQITLTKHYIGADITNGILSIAPMMQGDISLIQDPVKMTITGANVIASVYPGVSYISIDAVDPSSSLQSPANISIGDLVYVKTDNCNTGDTDNGDGTCTGYLCQIGELDIGNNQCRQYSCNTTNIGSSTQPNIVSDTNNNDGTCTTSRSYLDCNIAETYEATDISGRCIGTESGNNISYAYTRDRSVKNEPYSYNILDKGIVGNTYIKGLGNISYIYNKTIGPYVVSMAPSANKILIKSFATGDMDNGNLLYNPTVLWRKEADSWAKYKVNPFYGIQKTTGAVARNVGAFPSQNNTINLKALPENGLLGAKLYKAVYNNGKFNGSYSSLKPDSSTTSILRANSIVINTRFNNTLIDINGIKLLVGQEYTLTVTVKATNACTLQVESMNEAYSMLRAQWSDETPGYIGTVIPSSSINNFDLAKRLCESKNNCSGVTYSPSSLLYTLRNGRRFASSSRETSWIRSAVVVTNPTITNSFKPYTWKFVARNSNLNLRAFNSRSNTIEINRLDIIGGVIGPLMLLGTSTSASVRPITEGLTCLSGYYSSSGLCIKCAVGQYSNTDSTTCTPCAAGTYSAATGATSCTKCPAGKWSPVGASICT